MHVSAIVSIASLRVFGTELVTIRNVNTIAYCIMGLVIVLLFPVLVSSAYQLPSITALLISTSIIACLRTIGKVIRLNISTQPKIVQISSATPER